MKYTITSIKKNLVIDGLLDDAIAAAMAMDEEFQPAFGVQVVDEDGEVIWDS